MEFRYATHYTPLNTGAMEIRKAVSRGSDENNRNFAAIHYSNYNTEMHTRFYSRKCKFLPENNFEIISITIERLIPNYWEQNLLPSIFGHTQCAGLSSLGHWPLATGQDSSQ